MRAISPFEELKNWFNLDNYEPIKSFTIKELHREIVFREVIFDSINFEWEDENQNLKSILDGNPILSRQENYYDPYVKGQKHVVQISFGDIEKLEKKLIMFDMDFFEQNGDFKKELKNKPITQTMRDFFLNKNSSKMYVSFDLGLSSDEEIISALQTMLPTLRKEYEIDPVKTEKIGLAKIRKIVDYNIIPMMDLLIWSKFKKAKISNMVLSRVLYPDFTHEIRGEDHIKDTDRPVAEKALNGEITRSLEYFLSKNSHLINIPISELGSL
ncbi:hypothetical protein NAE35_002508 [Salmonella enterica]|uniref:Uncharacterized protein n=1 Tax=Salmonella enterica TaxID=28901 RepID=A0A5U1JCI2_SALER|nr:hypothetical protein [Salmonella enterica]EEA3287472.1 hypothetical protein [Salmonella enterica subsp. enterica serovar Muenchen]EAR2937004.1 hypothetical protein [Salmonella enterica]EAU6929642.1 hypothetical protein [Salmonella enterica]EAZ6315490.1 hypothetical protein [Salmonella enterica]